MRKVTLRDVLEPRNDIVHPRDKPTGDGIFVGLEHIEPNTGRRIGSVPIRLEELTGRKARFFKGDIVYGYLRPYLNKVWVADFSGYCSVDQYVFKTRPGFDAHYIAAFMRSPLFLQRAPIEETPGQLTRIRTGEVLSVELEVPELARQAAIATSMEGDARSAGQARQISELLSTTGHQLLAAIYETAMPGAEPLAVAWQLSDNPGWRWIRLDSIARLESGHTPSRSRPDWWGGDVPWVQLADIRAVDGQVIQSTLETTNAEGIAHSAARILPADTVVMSRTASVGFVARMGRPMATSQDFVNWVCGPDLDPEFLMHLLIRSRGYIRSLSAGAIHQTVYYPTVKDFHVCIPPLAEQRRIAAELRERLATIDAMTRAIEAQREAIDALPAALLKRAFEEIEAA